MPKKQSGFTSTWTRHDEQHYYEKVSRWILLNWLIKGRIHLCWTVPATKRNKGVYIKPNKES